MMRRKSPMPARRRRGAEAIEFAVVFPAFIFMVFGLMEYSWLVYQKAAIGQAIRGGCRAAGYTVPETGEYTLVASTVAQQKLQDLGGITCGGNADCSISFPADRSTFAIPRLVCEMEVTYVPLTSFFAGTNLVPRSLTVRAATIFGTAEI